MTNEGDKTPVCNCSLFRYQVSQLIILLHSYTCSGTNTRAKLWIGRTFFRLHTRFTVLIGVLMSTSPHSFILKKREKIMTNSDGPWYQVSKLKIIISDDTENCPLFCVEFICSSRVSFSPGAPPSSLIPKSCTYSKLPSGMNERVNSCLYISPWWDSPGPPQPYLMNKFEIIFISRFRDILPRIKKQKSVLCFHLYVCQTHRETQNTQTFIVWTHPLKLCKIYLEHDKAEPRPSHPGLFNHVTVN